MDEEENIRPPDEVVRTTLREDMRPQDSQDLEEALYQSMQDLEAHNAEQIILERELVQSFILTQQTREKEIESILTTLLRFVALDKEVAALLDTLSPILYAYAEGHINIFCCEEEEYLRIFRELKKIRLREEDRRVLERLILLRGG